MRLRARRRDGVKHLRTGERRYDLRSYVAIHLSLVLGVGVLVTGSIWAKASWGSWWVWDEPTLVSFLIVFLLYACYQPLRFSIEDPERQARYASVFAVVAGAFVPLNFIAVRLAEAVIHPRVFATAEAAAADMRLAFLVCLVGMALLYLTLWRYEMAAKLASAACGRWLQARRRRCRRPARAHGGPEPPRLVNDTLPDNTGYVAAAYLVFLALVLVYVAIMAVKLTRLERDLSELDGSPTVPVLRRPIASTSRYERGPRPRHLPQDRAGRPARADGAHRRPGRPAHARDGRARRGIARKPSPSRRAAAPRSTWSSDPVQAEDRAARPAGAARGHPAGRARRHRLLAAQLRRGAPALPRDQRAGVGGR